MPTHDYLSRPGFISARWLLLLPAILAFLRGARHTYEVFDWVWAVISLLVVFRVVERYWGRTSLLRVLISKTDPDYRVEMQEY